MKPQTFDDHNFFVQTPICTFLDSMEIYLSLDPSIYRLMQFELILCPKMMQYGAEMLSILFID